MIVALTILAATAPIWLWPILWRQEIAKAWRRGVLGETLVQVVAVWLDWIVWGAVLVAALCVLAAIIYVL